MDADEFMGLFHSDGDELMNIRRWFYVSNPIALFPWIGFFLLFLAACCQDGHAQTPTPTLRMLPKQSMDATSALKNAVRKEMQKNGVSLSRNESASRYEADGGIFGAALNDDASILIQYDGLTLQLIPDSVQWIKGSSKSGKVQASKSKSLSSSLRESSKFNGQQAVNESVFGSGINVALEVDSTKAKEKVIIDSSKLTIQASVDYLEVSFSVETNFSKLPIGLTTERFRVQSDLWIEPAKAGIVDTTEYITIQQEFYYDGSQLKYRKLIPVSYLSGVVWTDLDISFGEQAVLTTGTIYDPVRVLAMDANTYVISYQGQWYSVDRVATVENDYSITLGEAANITNIAGSSYLNSRLIQMDRIDSTNYLRMSRTANGTPLEIRVNSLIGNSISVGSVINRTDGNSYSYGNFERDIIAMTASKGLIVAATAANTTTGYCSLISIPGLVEGKNYAFGTLNVGESSYGKMAYTSMYGCRMADATAAINFYDGSWKLRPVSVPDSGDITYGTAASAYQYANAIDARNENQLIGATGQYVHLWSIISNAFILSASYNFGDANFSASSLIYIDDNNIFVSGAYGGIGISYHCQISDATFTYNGLYEFNSSGGSGTTGVGADAYDSTCLVIGFLDGGNSNYGTANVGYTGPTPTPTLIPTPTPEVDIAALIAASEDRISARIAAATAEISSVSSMVRAGTNLLPITGGRIGEIGCQRMGDAGNWYLTIAVDCLTAADPGLKIDVVESDAPHAAAKTQEDFTRTQQSASAGIGDVTPIRNLYSLNVSGMPLKNFNVLCHIQNQGYPVTASGVLVNAATPEFTESISTTAWQDAAELTLRDIQSGSYIRQATAWIANGDIARATTGQSDQYSTFIPDGGYAWIETSLVSRFNGSTYQYFSVNDYSETSGKISKPSIPVTAYATRQEWMTARGIVDASLTVAGGQY